MIYISFLLKRKDNAIRVDAFRLLKSMTNDSLNNVQIEAMSAVHILSQNLT